MDDPQKQQNQQLQQSQQPVQTPQSVTPGGKEHAPMPSVSSSEWVAPSTPEVNIPQELKEHGVEAKPVAPILPTDVKQAGVKVAKDATPVTVSADEESLGLNTPPSVLASIKQAHSNITHSIRWLAEVIGLAQKKRDHEIAHPSDSTSVQHKAYEQGGKE